MSAHDKAIEAAADAIEADDMRGGGYVTGARAAVVAFLHVCAPSHYMRMEGSYPTQYEGEPAYSGRRMAFAEIVFRIMKDQMIRELEDSK